MGVIANGYLYGQNWWLKRADVESRWSKNFDTEADWNITTEPSSGANNRQVNVSRGKFVGGCSGCNGTLCVRGTRQDFDSWKVEGWSGDEMWRCMSKVCFSSTSGCPAVLNMALDRPRTFMPKTGLRLKMAPMGQAGQCTPSQWTLLPFQI